MLILFSNLTEQDKNKAVKEMIEQSSPRQDFFWMTFLSVSMATLGLLLNSSAVVIGSMLIAPLLYPGLTLALGFVTADYKLIGRSFYTLLKASALAVSSAIVLTLLFTPSTFIQTSEIISRTQPSLAYFLIAVISGLAASFAIIKPQLNAALPGVAVSVALLPPLAVIGIGIAQFDWPLIKGSLVLFILNIIGIVFAGMFVFSLMNMYMKRNLAHLEVEKDEEEIKEEKELAEVKAEYAQPEGGGAV